MEENKRVLLGMSGGTDSSVAAMRLLEAGYEVIGVTFRFYELNGSTENPSYHVRCPRDIPRTDHRVFCA